MTTGVERQSSEGTLKYHRFIRLAATVIALVASGSTQGGQPLPASQRRVYFGDLHLHTVMSFDAWTFGAKAMPDQAYKFAKGETVVIGGIPARRAWPLDFVAVTDHAELLGTLHQLDDPTTPFSKSDLGQKILKDPAGARVIMSILRRTGKAPPELDAVRVMQAGWDLEKKAANDNYEPGKFTTFIAYEWTSVPNGKTLHRNVFFNSNDAPLPFSAAQSERPEDLWSYIESVRARGIDAIAIPHNGNVSGGLMYDWNDSDGKPIDEAYAERRARNEPLTEIVQNKGQSETAPAISPNDEFANFELYEKLLPGQDAIQESHGSYVREALGRGLIIQERVKKNPFKYGVVGATDIHNGLSTSDESAIAGGPFGIDPSTMLPNRETAKRALDFVPTLDTYEMDAKNNRKQQQEKFLEFSSGGLTGVWAEENTRDSIFASLKRKETFATSGTRIRLRVFGGWNLDSRMLASESWVSSAYSQAVPMGADLPKQPSGSGGPQFVLWALKDPDGANLDRIQVVKLSLSGGTYKERIYDVALSDHRKIDSKTRKAKPVGNTVNLRTGTYSNTIGAVELSTIWQDPEFDPTVPAVYYARVLEIPTPRWSTLLSIKEGLPISKEAQATIQERAWSSPIWFTPVSSSR